jgi:hypothetical protein
MTKASPAPDPERLAGTASLCSQLAQNVANHEPDTGEHAVVDAASRLFFALGIGLALQAGVAGVCKPHQLVFMPSVSG